MLRDFFGTIKTLGVASNRRRREFEGSRINVLRLGALAPLPDSVTTVTSPDCAPRAFDEKVESIVDSHDGTNQIQHAHWCKGASHEWGSRIPTICANVSLLQSKPVKPVCKLPTYTTWL